jgi:hypothetical protein
MATPCHTLMTFSSRVSCICFVSLCILVSISPHCSHFFFPPESHTFSFQFRDTTLPTRSPSLPCPSVSLRAPRHRAPFVLLPSRPTRLPSSWCPPTCSHAPSSISLLPQSSSPVGYNSTSTWVLFTSFMPNLTPSSTEPPTPLRILPIINPS